MSNLANIIGLMAAFGTTVSFLPQAIKTIRTKDTSAISLPMYILFNLGTIFWIIYGVLTVGYPVIIGNIITLIFALVILVYKIKYK